MGLLKEFSIQLYSIREETAKDFAEAVRKVASLGYNGVEFAGYGDLSATEMKKLLDDCGIKSIGSHVGTDLLENKLDETIEYNKTIGSEYIICPWQTFKSKDDVLSFAEQCNKYGEKIAAAGMKYGYHNHAHEFEMYDGEYVLDILFNNTCKNNVIAELDLYWIAYAGIDIIPYIEKYGNRAELFHLKQIKDMESKRCVNLSEGIIDYKTIIEKGLACGCKHFILEQEEFDGSVYDSLKSNYDYVVNQL